MTEPSQPDTDSSTPLISVIHYHDTHPCSERECPYYIDNIVRAVNNHAKLLKALERIKTGRMDIGGKDEAMPRAVMMSEAAAAIEEAKS